MGTAKTDTESWQEKDQRFIWHPFTQMKEWEADPPTIIVEGDGVRLTDIEGKVFLDGTSSLWVNIHGHRHPKIDQALKQQIDQIAHSTLLGLASLPSIKLAEKLIEIAPRGEACPSSESENHSAELLKKVFYSDNGSTAIEVAVKIAFSFWQLQSPDLHSKQKFVCLTNGYHGDTLGSISVGGIDLFHRSYRPLIFEALHVPAPTCYRCPLDLEQPSCEMACADEVETVLKAQQHEIAGFVIEPLIQAAAGMLTAPPGYLKKIRALCTQYKVLMIVDEVATGFGRTGRMFASEHEGIVPDLMAISKGLTAGYLPLAATLTTQRIYDAFLGDYAEFKTFFHGHSYTGNALGCAVALANLAVFEEEKTLENLQNKIAFAQKTLEPWADWPHVGDVRQVGFMIAIELVLDKNNKTPFPIEARLGTQVCQAAFRRGLILRPLTNTIALIPPLTISIPDLKEMLDILGASIYEIVGKL